MTKMTAVEQLSQQVT